MSEGRDRFSVKERHDLLLFVGFVVILIFIWLTVIVVTSRVEDGSWVAVGSIAAAAQALAVTAGIVYAAGQLRETQSANRVDRTLRLHEDFTVGDVGAARHRVATRLYEVSAKRGRCYVPLENELDVDGDLRIYPPDTSACGFDMNQDVHHIVWFFQRVDAARLHDVVDNRLLHELIGWHAVRWDQTFSKLGNDDSWLVRDGLRRLARWARHSATAEQQTDWDRRLRDMFGHARSPASIPRSHG